MPRERKKQPKNDISDLLCNPNLRSVPFPKLKVIPVRDIPDDCTLVCVGPICYLACFGADEAFTDCDIVCDEEDNCFIICHFDND
ncbi:hypothetical protein [Mesobacillus subterraneus]|uniref:Spore coat protein n=1 Tax=Mesobacillus subterraneus TaxID=285983 RepID=A0A3R9ECC0_9BACI|nr:hypothetical protein [Mesobacillus subterraneus]RSD28679.1 hypothetical protein EJA10_03640 [Mesobacillus subterraneus]